MNIWEEAKESLNFRKQCREYNIKMWQCPQFIFLLMGLFIIAVILITSAVAWRYADPTIIALIILITTAILLVISFIVTSSFEMVAKSLRAKSDFISIMSHRLRSPSAKIKWQLDVLLNQEVEVAGGEKQVMLADIKKQNEKTIKEINDLLYLNFIEDQNIILDNARFSIVSVVNDVVNLTRSDAEAAGLNIDVKVGEDLIDVFADKAKIKNVIYHFIDNAIRYSSKKGEIVISIEQKDNMIRFSVKDEGIGIPSEEEKKVFTKFFRGGGAVKYQTEGTGIGLFISKAIVEKSGGKIGFTTIEGKGSTFWFTLPVFNGLR